MNASTRPRSLATAATPPATAPTPPATAPASSRPAAVERGWNHRAFVVLGAALSGLALPITGVVDHAAGHSTEQAQIGWAVVHSVLGGLFVGFCTWHIVLNRRALLRYLRGRAPRGVPAKEMVAAAALVGVVLLVTVSHALVEG